MVDATSSALGSRWVYLRILSMQRWFRAQRALPLWRASLVRLRGRSLVFFLVVLILACRKFHLWALFSPALSESQWLSHSEFGQLPFWGCWSCRPIPCPCGTDALTHHCVQHRVELMPCFRTGWLYIPQVLSEDINQSPRFKGIDSTRRAQAIEDM